MLPDDQLYIFETAAENTWETRTNYNSRAYVSQRALRLGAAGEKNTGGRNDKNKLLVPPSVPGKAQWACS